MEKDTWRRVRSRKDQKISEASFFLGDPPIGQEMTFPYLLLRELTFRQ